MTIVYSVVARSATVLCSHQIGAGNFQDVVRSMLPNIPTRNDAKTTYTSNNYMFHVLVENGLIFMCATGTDSGKRQPFAYLNEVKRQLSTGGLNSRAQFALENELDADLKHVLATEMERFSKPGGAGGDQLSTLQNQVDEVKGVMSQNIEKVLERGERLDDLLDKTTDLESHSMQFKKTARKVHRKMYLKNMKMKICIGVSVVVGLLILILIILFSTGVLPVKPAPPTPATTIKPPGGV